MNKPTANKAGDVSNDVVPEIADDPIETGDTGEVVETAGQDADEPAEKAAQPEDYRADIRKSVTQVYREMRDKADAEARERRGIPHPAPVEAGAAEEAEPEAESVAEVAPVDKAAPITDDTEIELVVYGNPVKKTLKEIKAEAQKSLAADTKLDEAKRLAAEAAELLKGARAQRAEVSDPEDHSGDTRGNRAPQARRANPAPEDQPDEDLDVESLDSIVERIQVGDKDEGRAAVKDLVKLVTKGNTSLLDETKVINIVRQHSIQSETKKEVDSAIETFSKKFPNIASDDDLTDVALRRVSNEMRADLRASGMSDEQLSKVAADPAALAALYGERRHANPKMRSVEALLTDVGTYLTTKFGGAPQAQETPKTTTQTQTPPAASKVQQRQEMKRAASQQPKAVGTKSAAPAAPRPKTPSEIVAEMRRARGFPT